MIINIVLSIFLLVLSGMVCKLSIALYKEPIEKDKTMSLSMKILLSVVFFSANILIVFYVFVVSDAGLMSIQSRFGADYYGPYAFSLIILLVSMVMLFGCLILKIMRIPR